MAEFKVALLGTGTAAKEHIKGWLFSGAKVVATSGPEPPSAEVRRLIPGVSHLPRLLQSVTAGIDAVDICTPHHLHMEQLLEMYAWPISILVEKPLVTTVEDLESLRKIIQQRQYPIIMRTNKRFEGHIIGFLGFVKKASRPLTAKVTWRQRPEYMARREWYRCRSIARGGVVLGMGIHYFDVLAELATKIVIQDAVIRTYRCPPNAPDTTSENYAKISIASPKISVELILSAWKARPSLPEERVLVLDGAQHLRFNRQDVRDVKGELSREFEYYREVMLSGYPHPRKEVMLRAHELALQVYEMTAHRSSTGAPGRYVPGLHNV